MGLVKRHLGTAAHFEHSKPLSQKFLESTRNDLWSMENNSTYLGIVKGHLGTAAHFEHTAKLDWDFLYQTTILLPFSNIKKLLYWEFFNDTCKSCKFWTQHTFKAYQHIFKYW